MRRELSKLLVASTVILSVLLIPTALAVKPTDVSGTWSWTADIISDRWANGNWFLLATEYDDLEGTFNGLGEGKFKVTDPPPSLKERYRILVLIHSDPTGSSRIYIRGGEGQRLLQLGTLLEDHD